MIKEKSVSIETHARFEFEFESVRREPRLIKPPPCVMCADQLATVKITPSDDRGRTGPSKRPIMMMKAPVQDLSAANLVGAESATNMLRAPTEEAPKSRW